jgi:hypothetical protein
MKDGVDLADVEREMERLDAVYRPVAARPVRQPDLDTLMNLGAKVEADLARLGVEDQAAAVVQAIVDLYAAGDETVRATLRGLFDRNTSFRWAAHLARDFRTADEFRARLIHLSARDQGADPRDEIMTLRFLCDSARQAGVYSNYILDEVAAMSSDIDRYGIGSMRSIVLRYGKGRAG